MISDPITHSIPTQEDVENLLREHILSGVYKPGNWLPSERVLTRELNAQRKTVRSAIATLTEEGLLSREWNCRPVVQSPNQLAQAQPSHDAAPGQVFSPSRLVALVMWHGGAEESPGTAQQRIFWGMNEALGLSGYHGVFMDLGANIGTDDANAEREGTHLQYAIDHDFGGVVFYPYAYDRNHELVKKVAERMPLIVIDRKIPGMDTDFVGLQNKQAMIDAMSYLIGLGHRRIAYVTKNEPINTVQERLQGYLTALHDNFGSDGYEMVLPKPSMLNESWPIFDMVVRLGPHERPTAILCLNDYDAALVARLLESHGLKVPDDVSVIGCDNIIQTLDNGVGLTTLAQPFERIGAEAARLLLRKIKDPSAGPLQVELPPKMVLRGSCKPLSDAPIKAGAV